MGKTMIQISNNLWKDLNDLKTPKNKTFEEVLNELIKFNSYCIICGDYKNKLEKHHVEYNENVTIKVCKKCHDLLGSIQRQIGLISIRSVMCEHCGYSWITKSLNPNKVTCPSCIKKTVREEKELVEI